MNDVVRHLLYDEDWKEFDESIFFLKVLSLGQFLLCCNVGIWMRFVCAFL